MPFQFIEDYASGSAGSIGDNGQEEFSVIVYSDDPNFTAVEDPTQVMLAAIPKFSEITGLNNVLNSFRYEKIAPRIWIVYGSYAAPSQRVAAGNSQFSFSTTGGTAHITHSKKTVSKYARTGVTPRDFKGAIGVAQDGQVSGTDIVTKNFAFKVTDYISLSAITKDYIQALEKSTGKVNSAATSVITQGQKLDFDVGELLFLGAEGSSRIADQVLELTREYAVSRNATNVTIGDITGINKRGFDYLWITYVPAADPNGKGLVQVPNEVYIEQVYDYEDHDAINTPPKRKPTDDPTQWQVQIDGQTGDLKGIPIPGNGSVGGG